MPSSLTVRRRLLWEAEGKKCHWCTCDTVLTWEPFSAPPPDNAATIDHVIPRWRGGTDERDNVVNACTVCNRRRNYEDHKGHTEGSLLGRYPNSKNPSPDTSPTEKYRIERDRATAEATNLRRGKKQVEEMLDAERVKSAGLEIQRLRYKVKFEEAMKYLDELTFIGLLKQKIAVKFAKRNGRIAQWLRARP